MSAPVPYSSLIGVAMCCCICERNASADRAFSCCCVGAEEEELGAEGGRGIEGAIGGGGGCVGWTSKRLLRSRPWEASIIDRCTRPKPFPSLDLKIMFD